LSRRSSPPPPPPPLTPEQRALFESEPDLAEAAVAAAIKDLGKEGFRHLSRDEMLSIATIGAMEAATTFDPASRAKYRTWAFFRALHAVLNASSRERRRHAKTNALLRANVTAYSGRATAEVEIGVDTDASLVDKLHGFSDPVLGLALLEVAAFKPSAGGDDEVEAAALAGDALRDVLPPVGSAERRMLEMHFAEKMPLSEGPRRWASTRAGMRPSCGGSTACSPRCARASRSAAYGRCRRGERACRAAPWAKRSDAVVQERGTPER
jgi:DNA-directed RNA polymerase specialized sigma24 family protein